jgi:hypothetical protein
MMKVAISKYRAEIVAKCQAAKDSHQNNRPTEE